MTRITVLGFDFGFVENIKNTFFDNDNVIISNSEAEETDILIISNQKIKISTQTKILIIPDDVRDIDCVKADIAISCGISDRNTITLSSSVEGCEMASVQREMLSIDGRIIEPQEIELKDIRGTTAQKLIICALKLVLGS